ncbi:MAG: hypothetical protein JW828_03410 [Sedimentisphaerales bacterium]|nr:hypothetical protein [Sedimentisphaerales bacterium]
MNKDVSRTNSKKTGSAVLTVVMHGLLPAAWFVFLVLIWPLFFDVLKNMNAELPASTRVLVLMAQAMERYYLLALIVLGLGLLADVLIYLSLLHSARPYLGVVWSVLVVLLEIGVTAFLFAAVYVAMLSVAMEGI